MDRDKRYGYSVGILRDDKGNACDGFTCHVCGTQGAGTGVLEAYQAAAKHMREEHPDRNKGKSNG